MAVISQVESIGGGQMGVGWVVGVGWVGSHRRGKANTKTQMAVLCHHAVGDSG